MKNHHKSIVGIVVAAAALSGCGKAAEKSSEAFAEKLVEQQTGGEVDIDTSGDGSFKMETEDGSFSSGSEMPKDWPDFIPMPEGFELASNMSFDDPQGRTITLTGSSPAKPSEILDMYKSELGDWTMESDSTMGSGDAVIAGGSWRKGEDVITLSTSQEDANSDSVVVLGYVKGTQ